MPWPARLRSGALPGLLAVAASAGLAMSCVSVTATTPSLAAATATATESPLATALVTASAEPAATPSAMAPFRLPTASPLALPSPPATAAAASLDARALRKLKAIMRRTVGKKRVAGLQVALRLPDGGMWLGSAGSARFLPQRPVEDDTVFSVASLSKTFIAALILELAEEGRLDLDEPFGQHFSDAPRKDSVSIRQLLSHTSGIYNYFEHPRYARISRAWLRAEPQPGRLAREHRWTYDEIMDLVKTGYCRPGECYHYSNTNYVILGRIAEVVGGQPLHEQLRARYFEPLGLADTYYQPTEVPPIDAAHGHWVYGSGYSDHTRDAPVLPFMAAVSVADAAGAIASTARDMAVWAEALYGGAVLSDDSLAQMTTFLPAGDYGLGADVAVFAGHRGYGHRGGLRGFEASMWYFPREGVSVVLLSNQGNWLTDTPMEQLVRAVLGKR